ncbi:MAG: F0F1 ATP synthase subunit B [Chloroflexota bacterium]
MEGLASLGINVPVLVAQIINFIVLFGLLYLGAYKPIMRMLDARSRRIKESMAQADSVEEQAASAKEEMKKQLEIAGKEGQDKIAKAVQIGEDIKQKARGEAKQEAETLVSRAREEIQRERDEVIGEVRKEFADLTVMVAGKVIDRSLDKKAHRQLIEKALEESTTLKES